MAIQEYIKRIEVGSDEWEICAKALQDENGDALTWTVIKELLEQSFDIVVISTLPAADATSYETYHNCLVLVPKTGSTEPDMSDEYVIQRSGTSPSYTYRWEYIGCTAADLTNYVQKGTYATQAATGNTGSAGAETITISYAGNATGTGEIEYDKVSSIADHTISAHSHTVNKETASITYVSGVANDGTVSVVTGVAADGTTTALTAVSVNSNKTVVESISTTSVTVTTEGIKSVGLTSTTSSTTGAIAYIDGISGSAPALSGTTIFVTGYPNFSGGSLTGTKTFNTNAIKSASLTGDTSFMANATVTNGVLSFSKGTVGITTSAASTGTVGFTQAALGTASTGSVQITGGNYSANTTKYIKPTTTAAGTTTVIQNVTSETVSVVAGITSSGTTVLKGVKASGTATVIKSTGLNTSAATFMTGATLGTAGATTLAHSINYTTTTISVSVAVPINHEHTVNVSNHTHSLGNHTHNITFS